MKANLKMISEIKLPLIKDKTVKEIVKKEISVKKQSFFIEEKGRKDLAGC